MRGDSPIADVYNALRANTCLVRAHFADRASMTSMAASSTMSPRRTLYRPTITRRNSAFNILGFRVPAILASPLLDPGVVFSHVFDHTSLPRMAANLWPGVRPLGRRAAQANDPLASPHLARDAAHRSAGGAGCSPTSSLRPASRRRSRASRNCSSACSSHLESEITHAVTRGGLMARAHEALGDGLGPGQSRDRPRRGLPQRGRRGAAGLLARLGAALRGWSRR